MKYLLDTNIIIYFLKNQYPNIKENFKLYPSTSIAIPTPVIAELEYGCRKSNNYEKNISKYRRFINAFEPIAFTSKAAEVYGRIRTELEKEGKVIGPNDLMIASIAIAEDCVVVTHNFKEFSRIHGIKVADWTKII